MYKLINYSDDLDLNSFYANALKRGFVNNSSKKTMIDCFANERDWHVWILYQNDEAIGSVATHSLDVIGPNAYRICARTCSFAEARPRHALITINRLINEHQNLTAQFFIPACIEYCPSDSDLYITSNESKVASQRQVHTIYCPTLEKSGVLTKTHELEYRGHVQSFWKLNKELFLEQLNSYPRW